MGTATRSTHLVRVGVTVVVTLLCALGVAEIALRRLRPDATRASLIAAVDRARADWSRPDAAFHHVGDGIFRLEFPGAGSPTPRLLIVGDSFAMGHRVGREGRFGTEVQRRLGERVHVDVLATSSYSPMIYRTIVRRALKRNEYAAVAVFVDQTDPADEVIYFPDLTSETSATFDVEAMQRRDRRIDEVRAAMRAELGALRRSVVFNVMWPQDPIIDRLPSDGPAARYVQLSLSRPVLMRTFQHQPEHAVTQTMEALLLRHLDEVVDECVRRGIPLWLVANPWEQQVSTAPRGGPFAGDSYPCPNRLEQLLVARYGSAPRVTVLPLTRAFRAVADPSSLYLDDPPGEVHWNEAGHRRTAAVLVRGVAETFGADQSSHSQTNPVGIQKSVPEASTSTHSPSE